MQVLGIESSTAYTGVAVVDEQAVLGEQVMRAWLMHSHYLLAMVERLLRECGVPKEGLDGIAVSVGPGSFTGLRVGVATAKALAYALGKSLAGIPTLDVLARGVAVADALICPVLDARMGEVYTCFYRREEGDFVRLTDYLVVSLPELLARLRQEKGPVVFVGDLAPQVVGELVKKLGTKAMAVAASLNVPRASIVAQLGMANLKKGAVDDPLALKPLYLRRPQAEVAWGTKSGRQEGSPCGGEH